MSREINTESWWPESPGEIFVARLTSNLNPPNGSDTTFGYVVVRRTVISSLNVVISEYGAGGIYPYLSQATAYRDALEDVITSREYKNYSKKSREVFEAHGIG